MRVPEGWEKCSLKEVIEHIKGFAFDSSMYAEKGVRIIRISDTSRNSIHAENPIFISQKFVNNLQKYMLSTGDIILSTVGSRPHLLDSMVGKAVKIPETASGSLLNQNLVKLISIGTKITNDYLYEIVKNNRFIFYISTLVRGNANQVSITLNDLFKFEFSLPPLPEQQKIAQILSTWDKAINTTEQLLANSQQQKKALMQQLLTGKKRLLDEDGVRFSGEWLSKFLGDFCEISTGKSNREDSTSSSGMYTFFDRSQDIRTSNIFLFDTEAVIVAGEGQEFVPKYFSGKFDLHQRTYAIMGFANSWGKFIYFYLGHFNSFLLSQAVGSTVKSLRLPMFQKMPIKLPSLKEQQKIATVLTIADREIELLQTKLEALKQEKKALMQQLLTGKRRVVINH